MTNGTVKYNHIEICHVQSVKKEILGYLNTLIQMHPFASRIPQLPSKHTMSYKKIQLLSYLTSFPMHMFNIESTKALFVQHYIKRHLQKSAEKNVKVYSYLRL